MFDDGLGLIHFLIYNTVINFLLSVHSLVTKPKLGLKATATKESLWPILHAQSAMLILTANKLANQLYSFGELTL